MLIEDNRHFMLGIIL